MNKKGDPNTGKIHRQYSPSLRAKVALEAIRQEQAIARLVTRCQVHPPEIERWKKTATERMIELFTDRSQRREKEKNLFIEELYKEIGQLKVELDWLKKKIWICR